MSGIRGEADGVIGGPSGAAARPGMKRTTLQSRMREARPLSPSLTPTYRQKPTYRQSCFGTASSLQQKTTLAKA